MGTPLRKTRFVANDVQPQVFPVNTHQTVLFVVPRSLPVQAVPRVAASVRLAPTPPRRNFSYIVAIAAVLFALTIFTLGIIMGTVFWFTYDSFDSLNNDASGAPSVVMTRLVQPPQESEVVSVKELPELPAQDISSAGIELPVEETPAFPAHEANVSEPGAPSSSSLNGMHLVIRQQKSSDLDMLLQKGRVRLEQGSTDAALVLYERVLIEDPENAAALKGKIDTLARSGRFESSIALMERFLKSYPHDIDVQRKLAATLAASQTPEALRVLKHLTEMEGRDASVQASMAKALAARGEIRAAIPYLDRAVRLAPGDAIARFNLAVLYDRAEEGPKALTLYRQILQLVGEGNAEVPTDTLDAVRQRASYLESIYNHE